MARQIQKLEPFCKYIDGAFCVLIQRPGQYEKYVLLAPSSSRQKIMNETHSGIFGGHGKVFETLERILEGAYWPRISSNVHEWVRNCEICQKAAKKPIKPNTFLKPLEIQNGPLDRVHTDLLGLLTDESGRKAYVMTLIDSFSCYTFFVKVDNKLPATIVKAIF